MSSRTGAQRPLLIVSSARPNTGFDRVLGGLLPELARRRDVHRLAPNRPDLTKQSSWTLHCPNDLADPFGTRRFRELVRELRPISIILHDLTAIPRYLDAISDVPDAVVIPYCPIDGPLRSLSAPVWTSQVARLVVYTSTAREAVRALFRTPTPRVEVIAHGIETARFFPLGSREMARLAARTTLQQEFGIDIGDESVVTLVVARNQSRKRLDLALRGFAKFALNGSASARLWLHTNVHGIGTDVIALAHELGIGERLLLTPASSSHPEVDERTLNLIYNACDIGLSTSMGEAWGLASFEHAATGAPQIMKATDTTEELWPEGAMLLKGERTTRAGITFAGVAVQPETVAAALDRLHSKPEQRIQLGQAALRNALRPELQWATIATHWHRLIDEVQAECA